MPPSHLAACMHSAGRMATISHAGCNQSNLEWWYMGWRTMRFCSDLADTSVIMLEVKNFYCKKYCSNINLQPRLGHV